MYYSPSYLDHPSPRCLLQAARVCQNGCPHLILLAAGILHHQLKHINRERRNDQSSVTLKSGKEISFHIFSSSLAKCPQVVILISIVA